MQKVCRIFDDVAWFYVPSNFVDVMTLDNQIIVDSQKIKGFYFIICANIQVATQPCPKRKYPYYIFLIPVIDLLTNHLEDVSKDPKYLPSIHTGPQKGLLLLTNITQKLMNQLCTDAPLVSAMFNLYLFYSTNDIICWCFIPNTNSLISE